MQKGILVLLLLATAGSRADQYEYATVIESTPVYETVVTSVPRSSCWDDRVQIYVDEPRRSGGGTLLGGVIGGAIGHAVGHSRRNKQMGTILGAVVGAGIANALVSSSMSFGDEAPKYVYEERCKMFEEIQEREQLIGYDIRYRYGNQTYTARMDTDPGDTIMVMVSVAPVN